MNSERFPFQLLSRDMALKVLEKLPFGTVDTQKKEIHKAKWYPFLCFELCSSYSADLCRSLKKRIFFSVTCNDGEDMDADPYFIELVPRYSNHPVYVFSEKEDDNNLRFKNPYKRYDRVLTKLRDSETKICEVYLSKLNWSVEEIVGLLENFNVETLELDNIETSWHDFYDYPAVQKLEHLTIDNCEGMLTEEAFLGLSLDSFSITTTSRTLTSKSINKFLRQWNDGLREIHSVYLYFTDEVPYESSTLDGLSSRGLLERDRIYRQDGCKIEVWYCSSHLEIVECD